MQTKWVEYMQDFDHTASYIKRKEKKWADTLSRKIAEV